jgi:hypothetical protein
LSADEVDAWSVLVSSLADDLPGEAGMAVSDSTVVDLVDHFALL